MHAASPSAIRYRGYVLYNAVFEKDPVSCSSHWMGIDSFLLQQDWLVVRWSVSSWAEANTRPACLVHTRTPHTEWREDADRAAEKSGGSTSAVYNMTMVSMVYQG